MKRGIIILLTLLVVNTALAQQYVQTSQKCEIYQISDNVTSEMLQNNRYFLDITDPSIITKKIKQNTVLEVKAVANIDKSYKYDAYIVLYKWKYYLIKKQDVINNDILDETNIRMDNILDSLNHHIGLLRSYRSQLDSINLVFAKEYEKMKQVFTDSLKRAQNELDVISAADKARDAGLVRYAASLPISEVKRNSLLILTIEISEPTVSGAFDVHLRYKNTSNKTINYIVWEGRVRNIKNEVVRDRLTGASNIRAMDSGPVASGEIHGGRFSNLLTNINARSVELTSLIIYYMNGSTLSYDKNDLDQLMKIKDFYYLSYTSRRETQLKENIAELNTIIETLDYEFKVKRDAFFIDDERFFHLNDLAVQIRPMKGISNEIMKAVQNIETFYKKNETYIKLNDL